MTQTLYTSHDCPFCARAVSSLKYARIATELRHCDYRNMPLQADAILQNSSIPLLVHPNNSYIDESWDIVKWALQHNDPDNCLGHDQQFLQEAEMLVETYDHSFMADLKAYTNASKPSLARAECEEYIEELEDMLNEHEYLLADHITIADISIVAFIRLFSLHEPTWFATAPYPKCRQWLKRMMATDYFKAAIKPHPLWQNGDQPIML